MIYFVILALLVVLSWQYDILGKTEKKEFWYRLLLIIFILVAGLRYRLGGDTINYLRIFHQETPYIGDLSFDEFFESRIEPLFYLLNVIVKSFGGKFYIVQLIQAFIVNGLVFSYIKKHSSYPFICLFFYSLWMYFFYNFEEMRASLSVAICLYANDYILEKKWLKGYSLYFVGTMFHYSTIILLLTPLFMFLKMNKVGMLILFLTFIGGFFIRNELGDYLLLFEMDDPLSQKVTNYANSDVYFKKDFSLRSFFVSILPFLFYAYFSIMYLKNTKDDLHLMKLQPLLMLGMIFLFLSVSIQIAYRFVHFYAIYIVLYFAFLYGELIKTTKLSKSLALFRACVLYIPFFFIMTFNQRGKFVSNSDFGSSSERVARYYNFQKYYPYYSIIDRNLDEERENLYRSDGHYKAKENEY